MFIAQKIGKTLEVWSIDNPNYDENADWGDGSTLIGEPRWQDHDPLQHGDLSYIDPFEGGNAVDRLGFIFKIDGKFHAVCWGDGHSEFRDDKIEENLPEIEETEEGIWFRNENPHLWFLFNKETNHVEEIQFGEATILPLEDFYAIFDTLEEALDHAEKNFPYVEG